MKFIKLIATFLICILLLTSCGDNADIVRQAVNEYETDLIYSSDYEVIAESKNYKLEWLGTTGEFCIESVSVNKTWFSNPLNREGEVNFSKLSSQLIVRYYDTNGQLAEKNSYDDCVLNGTFSYELINNGIRVWYTLGEVDPEYVVPKVIRKNILDLMLAKLDEYDSEEVLLYYELVSEDSEDYTAEQIESYLEQFPTLKKESLYILSSDTLPEYVMNGLSDLFVEMGYTYESSVEEEQHNGYNASNEYVNITIPVEYLLDCDEFVARIVSGNIVVSDDIYLAEISLLPYMGAAGKSDSGYMFVPDGSGALIAFNNGKIDFPSYSKRVFGNDFALSAEKETDNEEQIYLPVFGMMYDDESMLAIIEEGSGLATITAEISNENSNYNCAAVTFHYTEFDTKTVSFAENTTMNIYSTQSPKSNFTVRYCFLQGESGLINMARRTREWLFNGECDSKVTDISLLVNFVGAVSYESSMMGIPVQKTRVLTTWNQASEIIEKIEDNGISSVISNFEFAVNGGAENSVGNKVKLLSSLGSKNEYITYINQANQQNYLTVECSTVSKNLLFDDFISMNNSAKYIPGDTAYFLRNNNENHKLFLVSPLCYESYMNSLLNSAKKQQINHLSFGKLSSILVSNFDENHYADREEAANIISQCYQNAYEQGFNILADKANSYCIPYCNIIMNVPTKSSNQYLFDLSVPFYQAVLHGLISYTSSPVNIADDYNTSLLNAIETGSMLSVKWMYENNTALKSTDYSYYSIQYSVWLEKVAEDYKDIEPVLQAINNSFMIGYEKDNDVAVITYDNGCVVCVNYSDTEYSISDIKIAEHSFALVQ